MFVANCRPTVLAVASAAAVLGGVLLSRGRYLWRIRSIPGPKFSFIFGATSTLRGQPSFAEQRHLVLRELHKKYGPVVKIVFPIGRGAMICFAKAADVAAPFKDTVAHPSRQNVGSPFPRGMLALPTGPTWRLHRTAALPALSTTALRMYHPSIVKYASDMCDLLEVEGAAGALDVDVHKPLTGATLQIICSIGFGVDLGALRNVLHCPLMETGGALLDGQVAMLAVPAPLVRLLRALPRALMPSSQRRMYEAMDVFGAQARALYTGMYAEAKLKRVVSGEAESAAPAAAAEDATSLLQALARAQLPFREACDTIMTLLVAGHETTANTLSWCLLLLAEHPNEQDAVRDEVDHVCGAGPLEFEHLARLSRLRGCFFEALRLYSTVPNVARVCAADTVVGGYPVPIGSILSYAIVCAARDSSIFSDPDAFKPDRHGDAADGSSWGPFGPPGPRKCLGYRLAEVEGLAFLATVLRRFEVKPPSPGAPPPVAYTDATCGPKHSGLYLTLVPRKKAAA